VNICFSTLSYYLITIQD